jgi:hypothetical protein
MMFPTVRSSLLLSVLFLLSVSILSAGEFESLFEGSSLDGWEHNGNWKIEDGVIARTAKGGSLVYKAKKIPNDFELVFEWKVAPGSNSGVYYRPGQYEYQILDNSKHADGKNPRTSAASLYFCMAPSHDATKKPGEWNQGRIVCKGTVIQHWLNGEKVVGFDYTDPKYAAEVEMLRQRGGDVKARGAYLSLQDHGDPVWYRNIKLRELGEGDELDRTPVTPQPLTAEQLAAEKAKLARIIENRKRAAEKTKK